MFRIALIGGGIVGESFLRAIEKSDRAKLVALAEVDPERRTRLAARFGVPGYGDYREMLSRARPDVAVVALPHSLHLDAAEAALSVGAHVLVEKPLEISVQRCDKVAAAAARYGRQVFVGHTQRFYPKVKEAKRQIDSGAIGEPLLITEVFHQRYFTPGRPRWYLDPGQAGGGVLMNHGVHLVDRTSWLLSSCVTTVTALLSSHPDFPDVEALAVVTLEFESGARASLNVSGFGGDQMVTFVAGNEGDLRFGDGDEILVRRLCSEGGLYGEYQTERIAPQATIHPMQAELESFLHSLDRGEPPEIGVEWGRYTVAVVQAAYASARSGCPKTVTAQPNPSPPS